jgi:hypothetical protein
MADVFFEMDEELKKEFKIQLINNNDKLKEILSAAIQDYVNNKGKVTWK